MKHYVYLSTFLAVYRTGSMTVAAKQLEISQASTSLHIKLLEEMVGKTLFRRQGRLVFPTAEAHTLAELVTDYIDGINESVKSFSSYSETIKGPIKVGAIPIRIVYTVIPHLQVCIDKQVNFDFLNLHNDREVIDQLIKDNIDFGILDEMPLNAQIDYVEFYKLEYILFGAQRWENYLLPYQNADEFYDKLNHVKWISYNHDLMFIKSYIEFVFQKSASFIRPPLLSIVFPNIFGIIQASLFGLGVSVLPKHYCSQYLESKKLIKLYSPEREPTSSVYLAWKKGRLLNKRMKLFKDLLLNVVKNIDIMSIDL